MYDRPPVCIVRENAEVAVNTILDELAVKVRFVVVVIFHGVPLLPVMVQTPLPILRFRVPVPVPLNAALAVRVGLLLFTLQSKMHPVVDAVHAPIVIDCHVGL